MEGLEWEWYELPSRSCPSVKKKKNTHHCLSLQNREKVKGGRSYCRLNALPLHTSEHSGLMHGIPGWLPLCYISLSLFVSLSLLTSFSSLLFFTLRLIPLSCCDGSFFRCTRALQAAICSIWQFTLAKPLSNRISCWPLMTSTCFWTHTDTGQVFLMYALDTLNIIL